MTGPRSGAPRIIEVKRRLDGREQRFTCELLDARAHRVVVLYRFELAMPARGEASLPRARRGKPQPPASIARTAGAGGPPSSVRGERGEPHPLASIVGPAAFRGPPSSVRGEPGEPHPPASIAQTGGPGANTAVSIQSYGVFWRRRPYNCYYAVPAGGAPPLFVRFDVVRGVEFALELAPPEVRYTDLLLDLWVDADGARWDDADEVTGALEAGTLTPEDVRTIEATRALLDSRHPRITSEVRTLLRRLGAAL